MYFRENIKKAVERLTGLKRPTTREAARLTRERKPHLFYFSGDGLVPNNPHLPLILYHTPVSLRGAHDPAAIFEEIFFDHEWGSSWRNGIFDFLHYHAETHEVLGIARGHADVRFGGHHGKTITLKAGDVIVLPAGTGHQRISASNDLLVVGAYPKGSPYDEHEADADFYERAQAAVARVKLPQADPVYGRHGGIKHVWKLPHARQKSNRTRAL